MTRLASALAVVALVVGVAACDDEATGSDAPAGPPLIDACELLDPELAQQYLAGEVATPVRRTLDTGEAQGSECKYTPTDGGQVVSLIIRREAGQGAEVETALATLREQTYAGRSTEDVPDLGDAALWVGDGPAHQLNVFVDDDYLVLAFGPDVTRERAVELANIILAERVAPRDTE